MGEVGNDKRNGEVRYQKSYFDVLGLCCSSEVPLIEKILKPLDGIQKVSVIVPSKTVIVVHDSLLISPLQIVKALNQARLEATIRAYGTDNIIKKWPSPYILACGVLLLVSLFKRFFHPLQWFALAAVVVGMPPIIFRSIAAVRRYTLDINILMLIAVGGAVALGDYSEAGFIVFLFTVAEWLEARASGKATAGMSLLMNMAPQKAVLAETGQVVDARDVKVNTIVAVKAGEVIPIDGVVVDGRSEVDERSLTGESFPVAKQAQSLVWAGTLNIDGYISVRTTALAEHSAVAKMARLVEEAQNSRSQTQRLIDSCAKYYTPAVVIAAAGFAVIPSIMRVHNPKHWFQLALVLLVSACPCALVLSTPVATFCALLKAARVGLLIKGGDVLEALARIEVVAFDKTGTITRGEFAVVEFCSIDSEIALHELLYWVASIESKSSHPMASALVDCARLNSIEPKPDCVKEFHIYPGEGICGEIDGKTIYIGNKRIAARASCETVPELVDMKEGVTVGHVFSGTVPVGVFTLSDTCRTGSAEAIKELKLLGIKTAMLTGDSTAAAMHAQNQLGHAIEDLHAELLPEDKVRIINDLKTREGSIAMIGDGMNDAPALAMADVGISMGISGSAVAMETSHITLMSNDIRKIPKAIRLARKTHFKIIGNIFFSIITKIAILALAFAGHPLLWAAVLADVGTCLLVILNSMMLLRTRTQKEKKCCGSSHKSPVQRTACANHCAKGACRSASPCGQLKSSSCLDEHSCHGHNDAEELRMHSNCEKEDCHKESPSPSCCQESVRHTMNASQEHLISITPALEHQDDHLQKKHCRRHVACKHKPNIREDHRSHVTSGDRPLASNSSRASANICSNTNKNDTGECCKSDWEECKRKDGCSSPQEITREIGGCCRSYMKECGKKDSCCGGGMIPEIITE
ncbi:putative inactive cadmium/zinc-transporting ATPase HMA3 [Phoenix dactylifera]|uniref:Inactive cadmium/zinc-transporting ATPase HMA3 n=1 Tax=Phoenix dactylifera TaxID=42345 RepID=A0A8B7CFL4_PHODC|nr:putative inactive cadmium/zinc-transporting ATPase HMA3 [Phoenix dactylifera]XP_008798129.1 putative inactive cadmium/zinc-transporting ATPase HMA3 [Phoenix dactylifera]XP_038985737.1 putative inactive cadmium/zinc-transporting ATPase HMA3 [Phoenix dactylifera]